MKVDILAVHRKVRAETGRKTADRVCLELLRDAVRQSYEKRVRKEESKLANLISFECAEPVGETFPKLDLLDDGKDNPDSIV